MLLLRQMLLPRRMLDTMVAMDMAAMEDTEDTEDKGDMAEDTT